MKLQLQEIKSNLCKELHLNLPSIIDDELVEVEGVALHLGHFLLVTLEQLLIKLNRVERDEGVDLVRADRKIENFRTKFPVDEKCWRRAKTMKG